jgi:hypothetical protein
MEPGPRQPGRRSSTFRWPLRSDKECRCSCPTAPS